MMYTNAIAVLMQAILSASEVELPVFSPIALAHNLQIFIMRFYSAASRKRSSNKKNDNWESENARGSNECFKNCLFLQIISHVFFSRTPSLLGFHPQSLQAHSCCKRPVNTTP